MPGLDEAPEEALPLEEVGLDPRDHVPPPAQHPRPIDEDESSPEVADPETPQDRLDREDDEDDREVETPASQGPSDADDSEPEPEPEPVTAARPKPKPGPRRAERTQPVRQSPPAPSRAPAAEVADEHDDGDELIEEQVAAPAAANPKRPAAGRAAPRKSGRPSVPSWDDIMFGRKGD